MSQCLQQDHIPVTEFGRDVAPGREQAHWPDGPVPAHAGRRPGRPDLRRVESAEVIGSALLYPNQASDRLLQQVEGCMAQGVKG